MPDLIIIAGCTIADKIENIGIKFYDNQIWKNIANT